MVRVEISRSPGNREGCRLKGTGRGKEKEREREREREREARGEERRKNSEAETAKKRDGRHREEGLRFIAYLHIFTESPRRFIKFNVFTRVGRDAARS